METSDITKPVSINTTITTTPRRIVAQMDPSKLIAIQKSLNLNPDGTKSAGKTPIQLDVPSTPNNEELESEEAKAKAQQVKKIAIAGISLVVIAIIMVILLTRKPAQAQ